MKNTGSQTSSPAVYGKMKKWALIISLYLLIAVFFTYPLVSQLNTHIAGRLASTTDLEGTLYHHWFYKSGILKSTIPLTDPSQLYPIGYNYLANEGPDAVALFSVPFQVIFGFPAYYNIMLILILALNGISGYVLANYLVKDNVIAFLSGVVFAFNPYVIGEINEGREINITLFCLAFYIFYLIKSYREEGNKNLILSCAFFFISLTCYYFFAMFLVFFTVIYLLSKRFSDPDFFQENRVKRIKDLSAFLLILFFLTLGSYLFFAARGEVKRSLFRSLPVAEVLDHSGRKTPASFILRNSCDYDFFFRVSEIPLWRQYISFFVFIPILFLLFDQTLRRKAFPFFIASIFFYFLCLGPFIKYSDEYHPLPLYFLLFKWIPLFSRFSFPYRFVSILMICVAVLFGFGLLALKNRLKVSGMLPYALCIVLTSLCFSDYYCRGFFPIARSQVNISSFYHKISTEEDFAIIDLPFTRSPYAVLYRIFHKKKIMGGYAESAMFLYPRKYLEFIEENSFTRFLLNMNEYSMSGQSFTRADIDKLKNIGYRYLVIHKIYFFNRDFSTLSPEKHYKRYVEIIESYFGQPVYTDGKIRVYAIDNAKVE